MKKIGRELSKAGKKVKKEIKQVESQVSKASVKLSLASERDGARAALTAVEGTVKKIAGIIKTAETQFEAISQRLKSGEGVVVAVGSAEKRVLAQPLIEEAGKLLTSLQAQQKIILEQEVAARAGKDRVINIPDESAGQDAIDQGKQACRAAEDANQQATKALGVAEHLLNQFKEAIAAADKSLAEAERLEEQAAKEEAARKAQAEAERGAGSVQRIEREVNAEVRAIAPPSFDEEQVVKTVQEERRRSGGPVSSEGGELNSTIESILKAIDAVRIPGSAADMPVKPTQADFPGVLRVLNRVIGSPEGDQEKEQREAAVRVEFTKWLLKAHAPQTAASGDVPFLPMHNQYAGSQPSMIALASGSSPAPSGAAAEHQLSGISSNKARQGQG